MEKYKRQDISLIERENERDETYEGPNPQIDRTRTSKNYHVIAPEKKYIEFINTRLSALNLKRKIRTDAILMNSFIVSSDGDFFKGLRAWEKNQFFEDCTKFFADKYGRENIISAIVHLDETTPHLHLNFIPVNEGRLSSKSLFDRQKLSQLQTEFHEQVGKKYGLRRGKEGSQQKHLSTAEYKAKKIVESAQQKQLEIESETEHKKKELDGIVQTIADVKHETDKPIPKRKKQVAEEITALRAQQVIHEQELLRSEKDRSDLFRVIQTAFPNALNNLYHAAKEEKIAGRIREQEKIRAPQSFHGKDNGMQR